MRKLKYIRFHYGFITFSEPFKHSTIRFMDGDPISAGFYYLTVVDDKIVAKCYGDSVSLNLKSLPEDSELLTNQLNEQW